MLLTNTYFYEHMYEVCSKSKVTFQISRAYFRLSIFLFCYVGTLFPNICTKFQLNPPFFLVVRGVKVTSCFACSAIFCYRKIWIKGFSSNLESKREKEPKTDNSGCSTFDGTTAFKLEWLWTSYQQYSQGKVFRGINNTAIYNYSGIVWAGVLRFLCLLWQDAGKVWFLPEKHRFVF